MLDCEENSFELFNDEDDRLGVRTKIGIRAGANLLVFRGDYLSVKDAEAREAHYLKTRDRMWSLFWFHTRGPRPLFLCIDSTEKFNISKYIKQSAVGNEANDNVIGLLYKVSDAWFHPHWILVLRAKRDIEAGEELLFDYGDQHPAAVSYTALMKQ